MKQEVLISFKASKEFAGALKSKSDQKGLSNSAYIKAVLKKYMKFKEKQPNLI